MKIMCIDYGNARLGIALTDEMEMLAVPFCTIKNENVYSKLKNIIIEQKVDHVVVGLPSDWKGEDTIQSQKIRVFAENLEKKLEITVELFDENYSTRDSYEALRMMGYNAKKGKKLVDQMAASLILKEYLKWKKSQNS